MSKFFKFKAEIVTGKCPTCEELYFIGWISKEFFRCMSCGADLEQHINGKISYIPAMHPKYFKIRFRIVFRWRRSLKIL